MEVYAGEFFRLELDGELFDCLTQITISEGAETAAIFQGAVTFQNLQINLQSWQANINGYGIDGYKKLRGWFREKQQISFRLYSIDGEIIESGIAEIINFSRTINSVTDDEFSASLLGVRALQNETVRNFLLLENGDYLLQESGDRIII